MTIEQKRVGNKWMAWFGASALTLAAILFYAGQFYSTTSANNKLTPTIQNDIKNVHDEVVSLRNEFKGFVEYLSKREYGDSVRRATEKEMEIQQRRKEFDQQIDMGKQTIKAVKEINK
jgi:septal ring factor EnvC (AmiA/AmiB activator)